MDNKVILLTGGSGFLGRQIIDEAKQKKYKIIAPRSKELNIEKKDGISIYFNELLKKKYKN